MKLINQLLERKKDIFYFGTVLLIILSTGCLSESPTVTQNLTVNSTAITTPTPVLTLDSSKNTPIIPVVVQTPRQISSDDIKTHFLDIALGVETFGISKRIPRDISMDITTTSDTEIVQNFILEFNDLSTSKNIFENIKSGTMGDLQIKFIPQEGMKDLSSDFKKFKSNDIITAIIDTEANIIYINNNLIGDQRNHTILRSLYYSLGVKGDSLAYPDSLFYYDDNNNTRLTLLDKKAVEILFGKGIWNGMYVDDIKQVIYLK
jgi:hypothetical protein